ncbi:subtilisin-like protease SBT1.5 [Mercurialis annua]|uniref:subtilisin-like protease SBT1.5 n=1 Tax=Mercurialis annua TaxID=3986 RepID=UPI002160D4CA|nr:subtilisin-like protease SBT1.5 [Mercurialis annua]
MVPVSESSSEFGPDGPVFRAQELGARIRSELDILQSSENTVRPSEYSDVEQWYSSILKNLNSDSSASTQILHVYKTVFEGFSAKLIPDQVQELEKRPEIIALFPEHTYYHQTTRSPDFLGLRASFPGNMYNESEYGDNVIIGLLDSGIWPELSSFDDEGLGPIPSHWKGECRGGEGFRCNKKLIGARFFNSKGVNATDGNTTRDAFGHGTHTASTAAGRAVSNADFLGFAEGTAVGVAPKARVAMYKVCYVNKGCGGADILAGFDKAVEDGVNVISVSLGSIFSQPLIYDEMAIGSFGAMEKGVIVTAAAGNAGEFGSGSVCNVAPWMITVGASTIDRKFPADILLEVCHR